MKLLFYNLKFFISLLFLVFEPTFFKKHAIHYRRMRKETTKTVGNVGISYTILLRNDMRLPASYI